MVIMKVRYLAALPGVLKIPELVRNVTRELIRTLLHSHSHI